MPYASTRPVLLLPELEAGALRSPTLSLLVVAAPEGAAVGELVTLEDSPVHVGRGCDCDLVVDAREVSRAHATLERRRGVWTLESVGRNGTRVNGVASRGAVPLAIGDRIELGGTIFEVVDREDGQSQRSRTTARHRPRSRL